MKRSLCFLFAAIMMLSLLPACTQIGTTGSQGANSGGDNIQLTVWVGNAWKGVYDPQEPGAGLGDFHREMAREYRAKVNPNVFVEVIDISGLDLWEKITVAAQTNQMPDIIFEADFTMFDYAHWGYAVPLNDIIDDKTKNEISPAVWESITFNGNIYCYPFTGECGYYAVNMDLFEKAGALNALPKQDADGFIRWTPDEFYQALKAVAPLTSEGIYPFSVYCNNQAGDTWMNMTLRMYGAEFVNDKNDEIIINSPEGVKALEFLGKLQKEGLLAPGPETLKSIDTVSMFMNKKLAVSIMNNLTVPDIRKGLADGSIAKPFNYVWAYIPSEGDPKSFVYIKGSWVFDSQKNTKALAAAKDFVKFYSSNEPYTDASMIYIPFRTTLAEKLKTKDPEMAMLNTGLKYANKITGQLPGYIQLRAFFYPELQAYFTGQKTAQEALDSYVEKANSLLKQNLQRSVLYK